MFIGWQDALAALLFASFALAFQLQRWGGYDPAIIMDGDAGVYTEVAAARANPQLFVGDPLLENADNYKFYQVAHIPAIQALGWLTGDYGKGMGFLLGPLVFIHLLGYYILGRVLYRNGFWALILSLTTSVYILTPVGDDVGLMFDPLPGFAFGALLPYLLAALIRFQDDTHKWKAIIACCAGLIYVHPVSGPAWVAGVWLFYMLANPDGLTVGQRISRAFALGVLAFLIALPFAAVYVTSHDTAPNDPVKVAAIKSAMEARLEPTLLHPLPTIRAFAKWLVTDFRYTYLALLSLAVLFYTQTNRAKATTLITVTCGVVLFSILLPSVEYLRTTPGQSGVPYQTELIRPLKYLVPMIFVLSLWGFCVVHESISQLVKSKHISAYAGVLIGVMFVSYVHRRDPSVIRFVSPTLSAWRHGDLLPKKNRATVLEVEAIRAVRRFTPEKSRIFVASGNPLPVRFAALRPVVYAYKDGSTFAFSNYAALLKWHDIYKRIGGRHRTGYSPADVEQTIIPTAKELGADYLLIYFGEYSEKTAADDALDRHFEQMQVPLTFTDMSIGHAEFYNRQWVPLNGLSKVWSNTDYGLYRLLR